MHAYASISPIIFIKGSIECGRLATGEFNHSVVSRQNTRLVLSKQLDSDMGSPLLLPPLNLHLFRASSNATICMYTHTHCSTHTCMYVLLLCVYVVTCVCGCPFTCLRNPPSPTHCPWAARYPPRASSPLSRTLSISDGSRISFPPPLAREVCLAETLGSCACKYTPRKAAWFFAPRPCLTHAPTSPQLV